MSTNISQDSTLDSEPDIDITTNGTRQLDLTDEPTGWYGSARLTPPTSLYEEPLSDSGSEPDVDTQASDIHELTSGHDPELTLSHIVAHAPYDDLPAKLFPHNELAFFPPAFFYGVLFRDGTHIRELGLKYEPSYLKGDVLRYMDLLRAYLSAECKVKKNRIHFGRAHSTEANEVLMLLYIASSWDEDRSFMKEDAEKLNKSFEQHGWITQFKWYLHADFIEELTDYNLPPFNKELRKLQEDYFSD